MTDYNRSQFEAAYTKYQRAPHTLTDADIAALNAFDPAVGERAIDARHAALVTRVPSDSPVITKSATTKTAEPSRTRRRDDMIEAFADVVVSTIKRSNVERDAKIKALEDRVLSLEADRTVREEPDRVSR